MMEGILTPPQPCGSTDILIYEHLRREFMADPIIRDLLPQFVRTYRNLNAFGLTSSTGRARMRNEEIISAAFTALMDHLEGRSSAPGDKAVSDSLETFGRRRRACRSRAKAAHPSVALIGGAIEP